MKYDDGPLSINNSDNIGNKQTRPGIEHEPTKWENSDTINCCILYRIDRTCCYEDLIGKDERKKKVRNSSILLFLLPEI